MSRNNVLCRVLGSLLFAAVIGASSAQAVAEPATGDRAALTALLKAGAEAAKAKKWQACIDAYSSALGMEEAAVTFGELGLCEEGDGRYASAHPHLKRAVSGLAPEDPPRATYQAALARVADQVAIVVVTTTPTEARLLVDSRPIGRGEGRNIALAPGWHAISAQLPGYKGVSKLISVNAREVPHLAFKLEPVPGAIVDPSAKAPAAPAAPENASSLPAPFRWCAPAPSARGVLGPAACVGIVALLASGASAIGLTAHWYSMRKELAEERAHPSTCAPGALESPMCEDLRSRRAQRDTSQDVLIGTGIAAGVLAGAAGVAIALERPSARVAVHVRPDGAGIAFQGLW